MSKDYFDRIRKEMDEFVSEKKFQEKLDQAIERVFENAASERFLQMYEKSKEA